MTKTNLKANHIRIENLYKSMFPEINNTSIELRDDFIEIKHLDKDNQDSANIEISETKEGFIVTYWDGYSLSEIEESKELPAALKIFKKYAKKMAKNLKRYSSH